MRHVTGILLLVLAVGCGGRTPSAAPPAPSANVPASPGASEPTATPENAVAPATADPSAAADKPDLEIAVDDQPPEEALLFEQFNGDTQVLQPFEAEGGVAGTLGSFDDNGFFELGFQEAGQVALAPITGVDPAVMSGVIVGVNAFEVNFVDPERAGSEFGLYCWGGPAQVGPAPREGARYEVVLTPDRHLVTARVEADGVTRTVLLDQPVPTDPRQTEFIAMLCRMEADGSATIGSRTADSTFFTIDPAPLPVGATAGLVARTQPGETVLPSIATFDRLEVYRAQDVDFAPA